MPMRPLFARAEAAAQAAPLDRPGSHALSAAVDEDGRPTASSGSSMSDGASVDSAQAKKSERHTDYAVLLPLGRALPVLNLPVNHPAAAS